VEEEYCWTITQAEGRSCCGRSGFSVLDFGFELNPLVNTYRIFDQTCSEFRLDQSSTCVGPS